MVPVCTLQFRIALAISWKYSVIFFSLRLSSKRKNCLKYIFIVFCNFRSIFNVVVHTRYRSLKKKKKKKKLNTFLRTRTKIPFKYPFSSNYNFYFTRKKSELYSYALVKTPGRLFAKPFHIRCVPCNNASRYLDSNLNLNRTNSFYRVQIPI